MEREYISTDISLRGLARKHGIPNPSQVMHRSTQHEWQRKRDEFRDKASEQAIVYMADHEGMRRAKEAQVRDNAIEAIDEAITSMRAALKMTRKELVGGETIEVPLVVVRPTDLATLLDRLNVLFGRPSHISEERNLGLNLSAGVTPEILKGIIDATRGLLPATGDAASSPIPRTDRTREN